jgi:hypothetical protein
MTPPCVLVNEAELRFTKTPDANLRVLVTQQ